MQGLRQPLLLDGDSEDEEEERSARRAHGSRRSIGSLHSNEGDSRRSIGDSRKSLSGHRSGFMNMPTFKAQRSGEVRTGGQTLSRKVIALRCYRVGDRV